MCILCVPALLFTRKQLLPRIAVKVGTVSGYSGRERRFTLCKAPLPALSCRIVKPAISAAARFADSLFTQPHAGTVP